MIMMMMMMKTKLSQNTRPQGRGGWVSPNVVMISGFLILNRLFIKRFKGCFQEWDVLLKMHEA